MRDKPPLPLLPSPFSETRYILTHILRTRGLTCLEFIDNFPSTGAFGTEYLAQTMPGLYSAAGLSMTDLMAGNTGELCGWMEGRDQRDLPGPDIM